MKSGNHRNLSLAVLVVASPLTFACGTSPSGGAAGGVTGGGADSGGSASPGDAGTSAPGTNDAGGKTPGEDGATGPGLEDGGDAAPLPIVINPVSGVTVSTLAGSDVPGINDGTGGAAEFDNPTGLAIDAHGDLLVTDYDSARVRLVTPAGVVTTIAAASGFVDPFAAAVATDGAYYVETDADSAGLKSAMTGTIWRVTPLSGGLAAPTVVAQGFGRPRTLAPIAGGNLFVLDRTQDVADQVVGSAGQVTFLAGAKGTPGYVDGTGASARFNSPTGGATMPDGSFIVSDSGNNVIRRVAAGGVVTTFAGDGIPTLVDGPCASASFNAPRGVAIDAVGNVYVSDIGNHVIRRISVACVVETVAGDGTAGFKDGAGSAAKLYGQEGIGVTPDGKTVYVTDGNGGDGSAYHRVRAIAVP
jgi:sugar lactone lactonase YvrE